MLLEFAEIEIKLEQLFLKIPEDIQSHLGDLKLNRSNLSLEDIVQLENKLELTLPPIFKQMILKYDFNNLTLGEVCFGNRDRNYAEYLLEKNTDLRKDISRKNYSPVWWRNDPELLQSIAIADSDGYVILLDTVTEKILAYSRIQSCKEAKIIADNFELFVRASATIFIKNQENGDQNELVLIPNSIGSRANNFFWEEIIDM